MSALLEGLGPAGAPVVVRERRRGWDRRNRIRVDPAPDETPARRYADACVMHDVICDNTDPHPLSSCGRWEWFNSYLFAAGFG